MEKSQLPVLLRAVAAEMDVLSEEWTAYVNRRTGELITVTDEDARAVDDEADENEFPDGKSDELTKIREVLTSEEFLPLPSKFDIDEYRIMERFCEQVEEPRLRDELLRAIRGSGAFGRFKSLAHRRGVIDAWYTFRDGALEDFAAKWLEANGIPYVREQPVDDGNRT